MSAMPVNVEQFRNGGDSKTITVYPGGIEPVRVFGHKVRVAVACCVNELSGTVFFKPKGSANFRLDAYVTDKDDPQGATPVETCSGRITILPTQELSLVLSKGKGKKARAIREIFVSMPPREDMFTDSIPQTTEPAHPSFVY